MITLTATGCTLWERVASTHERSDVVGAVTFRGSECNRDFATVSRRDDRSRREVE